MGGFRYGISWVSSEGSCSLFDLANSSKASLTALANLPFAVNRKRLMASRQAASLSSSRLATSFNQSCPLSNCSSGVFLPGHSSKRCSSSFTRSSQACAATAAGSFASFVFPCETDRNSSRDRATSPRSLASSAVSLRNRSFSCCNAATLVFASSRSRCKCRTCSVNGTCCSWSV